MSIPSYIVDQARAAFMIRADGGVVELRKYNGTTVLPKRYKCPAYSHYPTQDDLQTAASQGVAVGTEDTVINILTADVPVSAAREDRVDILIFNGSRVTFKVIALLKRQFIPRIGEKALVDRVLVTPIPVEG